MSKIRYYGKLLENLEPEDKENQFSYQPVILTQEDTPELSEIFNFLNNKDKDILYLIFISGKTQTDLVKILNRSQPSLSYDIKKIKERIKFICFLHSKSEMYSNWIKKKPEYSPESIMALTLMSYTTSFSQSARVSGLKSTKIRYLFDNVLEKIKEDDAKIYSFFKIIRNRLNIIRRDYKSSEKEIND